MVDQVANFKKVTVSTGYNSTATSIVLATGQGAELPDPSGDNYNVVWWDSTNYNDPADDPNVEIVRVTAKSTDTLTVTRNQESSGASNKNNADATYMMHLGVTAKTITDLIADVERCATVIVGKSGHVDYLTTDYGSDDACIQAAIDYVDGLGGGSILIREGTYNITSTILLKDNIIFSGVGAKTVLQNASGAAMTVISNNDPSGGNTYITVKNMKVDGVDQNTEVLYRCILYDKVTYGWIENVIVTRPELHAIQIKNGDWCTITNCYVHTTPGSGILINEQDHTIISNNMIYNCGEALGSGRGNGISLYIDANHTSISGNVVQGNSDGKGININQCDYVSVIGNTVHDAYQGIVVESDTAFSQFVSIIGNTIDNSYYEGIKTYATTKDLIISGNVVTTSSTCGIEITQTIRANIVNNICNNNTTDGIYIVGSGTDITLCQELNIENNICDNNSRFGIYMINNVKIVNINGNQCNNNDKEGISINAGSGDAVQNIIVVSNICMNNGLKTDESNTYSGIKFNYVTYGLIANNICLDDQGSPTQKYGIDEASDNSNIKISDNIVRGNVTAQIHKVATDTIVSNNPGYNPFGAVGPPSVPATTVNYTNAYGYPCQVQVYGGTVTEIDIDDIATGLTSGIFIIPPGGTINITYSATPSWRWWGL